jgi:hypothetical protein
VRIIALPDLRTASGARIPASSLSYTWKVGDRLLTEESGLGRSVLTATAPPRYRDAQVMVTVSTPDESIMARAVTTITPSTPSMFVYRDDPLLGPDFAHAIISAFTMKDTEETFRAVPYFFSVSPSLAWTLNGTAAGADPDVTVRTTGKESGTAALTIMATGNTDTVDSSFSVNFGAKTTGVFGL